MPTRLKVCCIGSIAEARAAIAAGASLLGLVGAMPSGPGPIDDDRIEEIAGAIPPGVTAVLLTSETEPDAVVDHVTRTRVGAVQLVDAVPEDTYRALRRALPMVKVIQVLHVEGPASVDDARRAEPFVDALLLDSGRPNAAVRELGGTGRTHDWAVSRTIVDTVDRPVLLAGGLRTDNIAEAIVAVRPWAVDVCSGLRPTGALDADRLATFAGIVTRT